MKSKKTQRLVALLLAVLMVAALAACGGGGGNDAATPAPEATPAPPTEGTTETPDSDVAPVQIGIVMPLTGVNADQGVFNVDGARLGADWINERGGIQSLGGAMIELVIYDNESDPDRSRMVVERMVDENPDLMAAHGAAASSFVIPMLPIFERAGLPFLTAQTSQAITAQDYEYVFAYAAQSPGFAAAQIGILEWINEEFGTDLVRIGIVYEDSEWGLTNSAAARDLIEQMPNFELAFDQSFTPGAADLSPIVVGLVNADVEVIFPSVYTQDARLLFNTMNAFDYHPLIVGGGAGVLFPGFAEDLGELVNGIISVASHNFDAATIVNNPNPEIANIYQAFEARFGYMMPEQAVSAFGAVYMIAAALEETGSRDRTELMHAIRALDISALTPGGRMNFAANGFNENSVAVMVQWQLSDDGVFRPRTVFPTSEATVEFQLTDLLRSKMGE